MTHRCVANPDTADMEEEDMETTVAAAVPPVAKKFQLPLRNQPVTDLALNLSTKCSSTTAESDSAFNSSPPLNNNNNSKTPNTGITGGNIVDKRFLVFLIKVID